MALRSKYRLGNYSISFVPPLAAVANHECTRHHCFKKTQPARLAATLSMLAGIFLANSCDPVALASARFLKNQVHGSPLLGVKFSVEPRPCASIIGRKPLVKSR